MSFAVICVDDLWGGRDASGGEVGDVGSSRRLDDDENGAVASVTVTSFVLLASEMTPRKLSLTTRSSASNAACSRCSAATRSRRLMSAMVNAKSASVLITDNALGGDLNAGVVLVLSSGEGGLS